MSGAAGHEQKRRIQRRLTLRLVCRTKEARRGIELRDHIELFPSLEWRTPEPNMHKTCERLLAAFKYPHRLLN